MESLVPRHYQSEILEESIKRNVIAWLETGSGKTYIAVMLIRWIAAQAHTPRKIVVFLANTVSLVHQQASFIREQTELDVRAYSGMGNDASGNRIDSWDAVRWSIEFQAADVFVITPALFLNVLSHAFLHIESISLLVLDEIHHCMKAHPYRQIMRDFYQFAEPNSRPKVFGMTASPIWNGKQGDVDLQALEQNTYCMVYRVSKNISELDAHTHTPSEIILSFPTCTVHSYSASRPSLWTLLDESSLMAAECFRKLALSVRYDAVMESLGLTCADLFLHSHLTSLIKRLSDDILLKQRYQQFGFIASDKTDAMEGILTEDDLLRDSVTKIEIVLKEHASYNPLSSQLTCSPKLISLIDTLHKQWEISGGSFQCIIFVSQRHVVASLCWILTNHPNCRGWLRPATLMGHGDDETSGFARGMTIKEQNVVRQDFKAKVYNTLIATSVAEEGLDFPECDLIVRFDGLQHMIGYIQSRGRARKPNSKYVIMLAEEAYTERKRYESFVETEGALKDRALFTNEYVEKNLDGEETPEEEDFDARDFNLRETYHNPVTGATLTFDTSVVLLARYCSSMPHDRFTPALKPMYTTWSKSGLYHARVTLPPSLPIEPKYLNYETTEGRYTKREARRAVAYDAVCVLHVNLRIFDDNLLPITSKPGLYSDDADGNPLSDISMIPEVLETAVVDPWQVTEQLLLYRIRVDDSESCIGLVTSSHLTHAHIRSQFGSLSIASATPLPFLSQEHRVTCERMMASYTEFCLNYMITSRPRKGPLAAFIVPLSPDSMMPDYEYMKRTPLNTGNHWMSERDNWGSFGGPELVQSGQLIENTFQRSRPLVLLGVSQDLTVSSGLLDEVLVYGHHDLKYKPCLSPDEHLVLVRNLTRVVSTKYQLDDISCSKDSTLGSGPFYLPSSACSLLPVPHGIQLVYSCLPPFMQRITDLYRANKLVDAYHLDGMELSHVVEALTLPSSAAGFSNQRLETLGDAVLKVAVVVHVYHKFPNYHEGQLSALKTKSISNRTLLSRGSALDLPSYMTVEVHNVRQWRFVRPESTVLHDNPTVRRRIPRRSIQDCMESLLGAAFLSGSISLTLKVGTHLDLCFGGVTPWSERYAVPSPKQPLPLFKQLETTCNYHFRCSDLLREALTHSTFEALGMPSYQRLEFLGDAIIDMIVTEHLFLRYPQATSGQLTWMRSRAVCAASLSLIAVRELHLHKYLLFNNPVLGKEMAYHVQILDNCSYSDMTERGWKYDPPKVISDLTESVFGAMFIDCGYNYDQTKAIILRIFGDLLAVVTPDLPKDPSAELLMKCGQTPEATTKDCFTVTVHDEDVFPPVRGVNIPHSKCLASEQALALLSDESGSLSLAKLCSCPKTKSKKGRKKKKKSQAVERSFEAGVPSNEPPVASTSSDEPVPSAAGTLEDIPTSLKELEKAVDDETIEGFATKGQQLIVILEGSSGEVEGSDEREQDAEEEEEVEAMLLD